MKAAWNENFKDKCWQYKRWFFPPITAEIKILYFNLKFVKKNWQVFHNIRFYFWCHSEIWNVAFISNSLVTLHKGCLRQKFRWYAAGATYKRWPKILKNSGTLIWLKVMQLAGHSCIASCPLLICQYIINCAQLTAFKMIYGGVSYTVSGLWNSNRKLKSIRFPCNISK